MPGDALVEILLVEDNAGDARLAREALREARIAHRLTWLPDGAEALAYLRRQGDYAAARRPDLMLLDLNIPRRNGREVLAAVKSDPELCRIPVLVLTTSQAQEDIRCAYQLNANGYISKPVDLDRFIAAVRAIEEFWLNTVTLPKV